MATTPRDMAQADGAPVQKVPGTGGVRVEPISEGQITAAVEIADRQLGVDYLSAAELRDEELLVLCASDEGRVVGFCTGRILTVGELVERMEILEDRAPPELEELRAQASVGILISVAVAPGETGRGIGTTLVSSCVDWLEEAGAELVFMPAWRTEEGIHIDAAARRAGFRRVAEEEEYWAEDSVEEGWVCAACGAPPCSCDCVVYMARASD